MTLERDRAADLFGLAGTFPRPGWVILDAARDHRFTGELTFDVSPEVRVYLDRGKIYLAERSTDPSIGARLVDAGALNAAQLEHGAMRIGDTEHLGRLFERVPSVDRQTTLLVTELMNESCVAWLARQRVRAVASAPYVHHPAGVHRWDRPADALDLSPGDPLPAPPPSDEPVEIAPPESLFTVASNDTDPVIHWDEPSWLDERIPIDDEAGAFSPTAQGAPGDAASILATDWVDRLEHSGLPAPGSDPLAPATGLRRRPAEPADRFEVIWPSGDVDADFPAEPTAAPVPDRDRVGPTARVVRSVELPADAAARIDEAGLWDVDETSPSFGPESAAGRVGGSDPTTDELALSMRRAVASIETGALAARRRLSDTSQHESSRGTELTVPGRVATRSESSVWSASRAPLDDGRSVFDEPEIVTPAAASPVMDAAERAADDDTASEPERVSALRRLIGGLRRR